MSNKEKLNENKGQILDNLELDEVPSPEQIFNWLKEMGYQTEDGLQEYKMYYDLDMPKILNDYYEWRNRHFV